MVSFLSYSQPFGHGKKVETNACQCRLHGVRECTSGIVEDKPGKQSYNQLILLSFKEKSSMCNLQNCVPENLTSTKYN